MMQRGEAVGMAWEVSGEEAECRLWGVDAG